MVIPCIALCHFVFDKSFSIKLSSYQYTSQNGVCGTFECARSVLLRHSSDCALFSPRYIFWSDLLLELHCVQRDLLPGVQSALQLRRWQLPLPSAHNFRDPEIWQQSPRSGKRRRCRGHGGWVGGLREPLLSWRLVCCCASSTLLHLEHHFCQAL